MNQAITQSERAETLVDLLTPSLIELMREACKDLEVLAEFDGFCNSVGLDYLIVIRTARERGVLD